jgi:hypothetical protein
VRLTPIEKNPDAPKVKDILRDKANSEMPSFPRNDPYFYYINEKDMKSVTFEAVIMKTSERSKVKLYQAKNQNSKLIT